MISKGFTIVFILVFVVIAVLIAILVTPKIYNSVFRQGTNKSLIEEEGNIEEVTLNDLQEEAEEFMNKVVEVKRVTWAQHEFEIGKLSTQQYQTSGNGSIQFTENGWYAPSFSMPRSKLIDVNLNEKVKLVINADFEGSLRQIDDYEQFSEFAIYIVDEEENRQGVMNLGTIDNVREGNVREKYKFTQLVVENTGEEIIVSNSSGKKLAYSRDFKYVTDQGHREPNTGGNYGELNPNQKWMLRINCHVNGEGDCSLNIKDIQAIK